VRLQAPYRCLFHYLEELRGELEGRRGRRKVGGEMGMSDGEECGERKGEKAQEVETESIEHLEFLLEFIEEEFKDVIFETRNYLPEGLISYEK